MLPIKTTREGDTITKVVVEDMYKSLNRILDGVDKYYNNSMEIIDSIHKEYDGYEGELIIGTGVSKPCAEDTFDEEIGNEIAFKKAKLNANLKKWNIYLRLEKELLKMLGVLDSEIDRIDKYIDMDIEGLRKYNPNYLDDSLSD